ATIVLRSVEWPKGHVRPESPIGCGAVRRVEVGGVNVGVERFESAMHARKRDGRGRGTRSPAGYWLPDGLRVFVRAYRHVPSNVWVDFGAKTAGLEQLRDCAVRLVERRMRIGGIVEPAETRYPDRYPIWEEDSHHG